MSTTPLPDLSPEDQSRLARFFAANEDPASLILSPVEGREDGGEEADKKRPILTSEAESANRPAAQPTSLLDAYAFLTRPDIAAWIAFHREQVARRLRNAILSALESSLAKATDPVEIRRASATILRALTASPRPSTSPISSVPPRPRILSSPSPAPASPARTSTGNPCPTPPRFRADSPPACPPLPHAAGPLRPSVPPRTSAAHLFRAAGLTHPVPEHSNLQPVLWLAPPPSDAKRAAPPDHASSFPTPVSSTA
jgi:hypothetical protein